MKRILISLMVTMMASGAFAVTTNAVTATTLLKVVNGNYTYQRSVNNYQKNQTTSSADMGIQVAVVNSTNAVNVANVVTPGYCFFRNLETTNSVFVVMTLELQPGDIALVPAASTNILIYSTVGPAKTEYWINAR